MPTVTVYLTEELYRDLLAIAGGERASAVAKRLLEEKIREEVERRKKGGDESGGSERGGSG